MPSSGSTRFKSFSTKGPFLRESRARDLTTRMYDQPKRTSSANIRILQARLRGQPALRSRPL